MIIVIDAYNLLRAAPSYKKNITAQERTRFIAQLNAYGRAKGHKIIVVFDGGPYEWPYRENMKTILVVYAGIHQTADDYIKDYLNAHRSKDLLLVSSDTELNQHAERLQIPSIDSTNFKQLLYEQRHFKRKENIQDSESNEVIKLAENTHPDIDLLMQSASKIIHTKSEDFIQETKMRHNKKKNTLSKQERILLKKLNKL